MKLGTFAVLGGGVLVTLLFVLRQGPPAPDAFVPKSDDEVLAQVLARTGDVKTLSPQAAADQSRELVVAARKAGGDPRLLGRAQAVLSPWWQDPAPPPQVLLMRATLKQAQHDFEGALVDLDTLVKLDPADAQAWLTRATVLQVLGRYDSALQSCDALGKLVSPETFTVCRAPLLALTGKADEAVQSVRAFNAPWALSVLGELQRWRGEEEAAQVSLRGALGVDPTDTYTRLQLADSLRVSGKSADVAALFAERTLNDAELLVLVLSQDGAESKERAELAERVAASRARGETLHRREESRYALKVEADVKLALELAVTNWSVQREPADAEVLLEAAVAARDAKAAEPVVQWLTSSGFQHPGLKKLVTELPR